MARTLGDAFVRIRPETTGFAGEAQSGLSSGLKKVAGLVAGVWSTRQVVRGAKVLVGTASEAQQSIGATEQIFKRYADTVIERSDKAAKRVGLSANEYRELANVTGAMLKSSGLPLQKVTDLTDRLNLRAADLAATFGGSTKEALQAVSSLLRGEADPIEAYGVSIKQSDVNARLAAEGLDKLEGAAKKQAEAQTRLKLLFEQTADAQGQSKRESDQWAGVTQRASARAEDLKAKLGSGLLPVFAAAGKVVADQLLPHLDKLTDKHLPKIVEKSTALINNADLEGFFTKATTALQGVDWGEAADGLGSIADSSKELAPVAKDLAGQLPGINDLLTVTGEVMGFAADHTDTLRKALPYLVAGFIAVKVAQLASNVAMAASPAIRIAEVIATRAQTKAILAQTAALAGASTAQVTNGVVTGTTTKMTIRQRIATMASAVAQKAITVATKAWIVVQKALNLVLKANPIGIVITVLAALVVGIIAAYKKSETFRDVVKKAFEVVAAAGRWLWNKVLQPVFKFIVEGIAWLMDGWAKMLQALGKVPGFGWAKKAGDAMAGAADKARGLADGIKKIPNKVPITFVYSKRVRGAIGDKVTAQLDRYGPVFDSGGVARGTGYMPKDTIRPERVLSPRQTHAFEQLVDHLDKAGTRPPMRGGVRINIEHLTPDNFHSFMADMDRADQQARLLASLDGSQP